MALCWQDHMYAKWQGHVIEVMCEKALLGGEGSIEFWIDDHIIKEIDDVKRDHQISSTMADEDGLIVPVMFQFHHDGGNDTERYDLFIAGKSVRLYDEDAWDWYGHEEDAGE